MQILTTGGMEDSSKYWGINRTFYLICCMFWIFSPAEGKTISEVVGSKVILHCNNESISTLFQLTWKKNGDNLFSFNTQKPLHVSEEALSLKINMSLSVSQLYALVIERVQKSHTGNYTCETNTVKGPWEKTWELIITEESENRHILVIAVAVVVPCLCCLIFLIGFIVLQRVYKQHAENRVHSPTAEMEQTEDIYENCLENYVSQRHGYNQHYHYKSRAH